MILYTVVTGSVNAHRKTEREIERCAIFEDIWGTEVVSPHILNLRQLINVRYIIVPGTLPRGDHPRWLLKYQVV